ncbi:hypothetical protein P152DRAFT_207532 [Eremomyces bilateralis CBS 781.70]|uniref:Thioesterase domain-containing protein n=1 Tax=Eremomyces bilateralis CBS 781.70 TaxID=1392243 RepID=A0A6G1FSA0_9PEZI|nr:uncharacterized protein P152DRAFT_207532 [Eremomyces bilateralis CBS 781.70]KAF1808735.1 hypothetical protein P152DRAFT_207532 [Eremomyces bilateralis CBS 781.70]
MAPTPSHTEVPQSTIDHFKSIPWCSPSISDPSFRLVSMSRTLTQPGNGHSLMAATWNTDETIKELLSMYRPADKSTGQTGEVRRFYTFGTGLNSHANVLHGGVIGSILDSSMGNAIGQGIPDRTPTFTVQLNISYKNPVKTPGTIMARSWVVKAEGRKIWVQGVIESGNGIVHATSEGIWLRAKPNM